MPPSTTWNAFNDRVAYEDHLRVVVRPLEQADGLDEYTQVLNARILECALPARDRPPTGALEETDLLWQTLARIDARLDLVTELLNRTLARTSSLPEPIPVRLNTLGLASPDLPPLPAETQVLVLIHFEVCRALPLSLAGRYVPLQDGGFVTFEELDETTRENLDRLVFLHHRQHMARTRQHSQGQRSVPE